MATKNEANRAVAQDTAAAAHGTVRSLLTGEMLRAQGLCPLVICRGYDSGVSVGYLASVAREGGRLTVELLEMRRVWSWDGGAQTTSELAEQGMPLNVGRISKPTRYAVIADVAEMEEVSPDATASLTTSRWI